MSLTGKYLDKFLSRVVKGDGCWNWDGAHFKAGYGETWDGVRPLYAHRVAYELWVGPIPDGYEVDHQCHTRACQGRCPHRGCVNPAHLKAVPPRENKLRGKGASANNALKTHCVRGHEYSEENTRIDHLGRRQCRTCMFIRNKEQWAKVKASRPSRAYADRTHCPQGHPYDEANTYRDKNDHRMCRSCLKERARQYRAAKRASKSPG